MLTPIDIQSRTFKGGLGYDRKDVDTFVAEVVDNYEKLYKENQDMSRKIEVLTAALAQYKTIEKSLQKALLLAQKTSEDIKKQAHASAKVIEDEARNRASLIISDSKNELESIHRKSMALIQQYELYRSQFEQLARTQVQLLKSDSFNIDVAELEKVRDEAVKSLDDASVTLNTDSNPKEEDEINTDLEEKILQDTMQTVESETHNVVTDPED